MERIIKFRALFLLEDGTKIWRYCGINEFHGDRGDRQISPFLQSTGLLDKKGNEIFDGDVLTPSAYTKASGIEWDNFKCKVIEHKGMFCFELNKGLIQEYRPLYQSLDFGIGAGNPYEIIGNIYELP